MDWKIDPVTRDLDMSNGLQFASETEEPIDRINLALELNLGEFFTHVNYGLPWLQNPDEDLGLSIRYFLGDDFPNTPQFIAGELDEYLRSLPVVSSVESVYTFDPRTREFIYKPKIVGLLGQGIEFPPYIQQL